MNGDTPAHDSQAVLIHRPTAKANEMHRGGHNTKDMGCGGTTCWAPRLFGRAGAVTACTTTDSMQDGRNKQEPWTDGRIKTSEAGYAHDGRVGRFGWAAGCP